MIAILKYNGGNIQSVQNAVNRLGFDSIVTDQDKELIAADKGYHTRCRGSEECNEISEREKTGSGDNFSEAAGSWDLSRIASYVQFFG